MVHLLPRGPGLKDECGSPLSVPRPSGHSIQDVRQQWTSAAFRNGLAAYDGALMIVSTTRAFLAAVGISRRLQMTPDAKPLDI